MDEDSRTNWAYLALLLIAVGFLIYICCQFIAMNAAIPTSTYELQDYASLIRGCANWSIAGICMLFLGSLISVGLHLAERSPSSQKHFDNYLDDDDARAIAVRSMGPRPEELFLTTPTSLTELEEHEGMKEFVNQVNKEDKERERQKIIGAQRDSVRRQLQEERGEKV